MTFWIAPTSMPALQRRSLQLSKPVWRVMSCPGTTAHLDGSTRHVASGKPNRGVNTLALWVTAQNAAYPWASGAPSSMQHAATSPQGRSATTVVFLEADRIRSLDDEESMTHATSDRAHAASSRAAIGVQLRAGGGYEPTPPVPFQAMSAPPMPKSFITNLGIKTVYGATKLLSSFSRSRAYSSI